MKRLPMLILKIIGVILLVWGLLILWVEFSGGEKTFSFGSKNAKRNALIYYNPDPIYNLDEQVCKSLAEGLAENDWLILVMTIDAAKNTGIDEAELNVFCANTYNFAPDRGISNFIKKHPFLSGKKVVALTLGSGTTGRAHQIHKELLAEAGADLIAEKELWLMRPNDDNRQEESNILVANDIAKDLGRSIE